MLDIIAKWASTSQSSFDLYTELYALNEKHGYGHEVYVKTHKKIPKNDKADEKSSA